MSTIYDWRRQHPERLGREVDDVRKEIVGARVVDLSEYGNTVTLELPDGTRLVYGCGGYEYDVEIHAA